MTAHDTLPPTAVQPLIELRHVDKTYVTEGTVTRVLRDVSLSIAPGEFIAIVGASGSGKSTLLNILGCLDQPTSGSYRFAGREVGQCSQAELAKLRREVFGFVFQQYHLVPTLTALENVEVPAVYRGALRQARRARAAALLARFGLAARGQHRPTQLSGGQQQRVSIARALMNGGRVLLADEPTGALDSASGQEVMGLLRELSAAGHTVIVVTHDRGVAAEARRLIEISDGRIVSDTGCDTHGALGAHAASAASAGVLLRTAGPREALASALRMLRLQLGRTLLTLLGIIVGVASVVALLALGEGTKHAVVTQLEAFGTNRLYVSPSDKNPNALTEADVRLVAEVPNVAAAMPYQSNSVTVRAGNVDHMTNVATVGSVFTRILNWEVAQGVFFDATDERRMATVAVLGEKLAGRLFAPNVDPLGKFVLVNNVPFQVIGILAGKGALTGSSDDDDTIILPFSSGSTRVLGTPYLSWISVSMTDGMRAAETAANIEAVLNEAHHVKDVEVFNKAAVVAAQRTTIEVMTSLLLATAIISLVVGGIGVMNVMLMTVTERTHEIGLRMAVGASRSDVLTQFLIEAIVLASFGGVLGLVGGWTVGTVCRWFGQKVIFSVSAAGLAFACAVATGLVCGYLPARRAAWLDPVLALARR